MDMHDGWDVIPLCLVKQVHVTFGAPFGKHDKVQRIAPMKVRYLRRNGRAVRQPTDRLGINWQVSIWSGNANNLHRVISVFMSLFVNTVGDHEHLMPERRETMRP